MPRRSYFYSVYTKFFIRPNQITNINSLKKYFDAKEIEYLYKCIFDFVIVDKEGYVCKVIELQKGKHHNDKEWIDKDNIKKNALEYLGIEFEEMY